MILTVFNASQATVWKAWKIQAWTGTRTLTSVMLCQLSYQTNWELVVVWVDEKPSHDGYRSVYMVLNTLNSGLKRRSMILAVFSASQAAMNCITSSSVDHCFSIADVRVRLPFQDWIFMDFLAAAWITLKTAGIIYTFVSIRSSNTWISRINIMCRNQSPHCCFSWWQTQGWSQF